MTRLVTSVHTDIVDSLFRKVVLATSDGSQSGAALYKDTSSPVIAAAREAWEKIQSLLKHAARKGWQASQQMLDEFSAYVEDVSAELAEQADQFRAFLLEKLHELIRETFDFVLRSIRSRLVIGGSTYVLKSVELETKLVYSSSIEASVTTLCKFVGEGEAVVTGSYSLAESETKT
jgi:vacuolar-type H+-ATPase subunit D/Vma8